MVLDPRVPVDVPARWLFVANANSDLVYASGNVIPIDLAGFFAAWMRDADACFAGDPEACAPGRPVGSSGSGAWAAWPEVGDVGHELDDAIPCRRNAQRPQLIECEDTYFALADAAVNTGSFAADLRGWVADPENPGTSGKLLVAVRSDPSITLIDVSGAVSGRPRLDCGQGPDSGRYDPRRCAATSALRFLGNDGGNLRLASEPVRMLVTPGSSQVLVTHASQPVLTVLDLEGQYTRRSALQDPPTGSERDRLCKPGLIEVCKDQVPAIIDVSLVFADPSQDQNFSGWGLARRPCFPGTENVPTLTVANGPDGEPIDCSRPLYYAGYRTSQQVVRLFPAEGEPLAGYFDDEYLDSLLAAFQARIADLSQAPPGETAAQREQRLAELDDAERLFDLYVAWKERADNGDFFQSCLTAEEIADGKLGDEDLSDPLTAGRFLCDARMFGAGAFQAKAFDGAGGGLGDITFSRDGNRLFAVQTSPGGLAYVDTSLDSRGLTRDRAAGGVELCGAPTTMVVFNDDANEYAAVTCSTPSELFVVDLNGIRVVANILLGSGPNAMTVDRARQYIYVANSLDKTISIVDISPVRTTRFAEVARIGLQVPYQQ